MSTRIPSADEIKETIQKMADEVLRKNDPSLSRWLVHLNKQR